MAESRQQAAKFEAGLQRTQTMARSREAIQQSLHLIALVNRQLARTAKL
jgi:hypothetical protein